ncbi:MAG: lycopene cyclase domain-containing protein [Patescibacteria group bacterium]|jgi:hypothetical protein
MVYVYLIGSGIYAFIWLMFFIFRKDLRKKILVSSFLAAPLGISECLFIPEYWIPQFKTIPLGQELFLESILFCFFLGGVSAVAYQIFFQKNLFQCKKINPFLTLLAPVLFLSYFFRPFDFNLMYYVCLSMLIGAFIAMIYAGAEAKKIIYAAIVSTLIYSIFYYFLWYTYPELSASYQFNNLSGILLAGIPVEEFLWIFSFSLYWAPIYEIWRKYFVKNYQ